MIQYKCNHCGEPMESPDWVTGGYEKCPSCDEQVLVRSQTESVESESADRDGEGVKWRTVLRWILPGPSGLLAGVAISYLAVWWTYATIVERSLLEFRPWHIIGPVVMFAAAAVTGAATVGIGAAIVPSGKKALAVWMTRFLIAVALFVGAAAMMTGQYRGVALSLGLMLGPVIVSCYFVSQEREHRDWCCQCRTYIGNGQTRVEADGRYLCIECAKRRLDSEEGS